MRICPMTSPVLIGEDDPRILLKDLNNNLDEKSWRLELRLRANLGSKRRLDQTHHITGLLDLMLPGMSGRGTLPG